MRGMMLGGTCALLVAACFGDDDDGGRIDAAVPSGFDAATVIPDAGFPIDAAVPDASGVDATGLDAALPAGCADGTREGFVSRTTFPTLAACAGTWTGHITEAAPLCQAGWHVCLGNEPGLTSATYEQATAFGGCFMFDAAQDSFVCRPDCSAAVDMGIDTAGNIDGAGVGAGCTYQFPTMGGCLATGRIDASENDGNGCEHFDGLTGAVCCED